MSRGSFAVRTVPMGPCDCSGSPHEQDEAVVKLRFTFGDLRRIAWSLGQPGQLAQSAIIATGVVSWNLRGPTGPLPIGSDDFDRGVMSVDSLDPNQSAYLVRVFNEATYSNQIRDSFGLPREPTEAEAPDPNPSAEPSADGLGTPKESPSMTSPETPST